jgi:trans-aconitate 2-methyltransferase
VFDEILASETWSQYFDRDFCHPHFFYSDREYILWLQQSGFAINRLELVPKDMTHNGHQDLAGWIRTAWMPFTNCVPETKRDDFINDFVDLYLQRFPLDSEGMTHVNMVRLEVDAHT